ncbi:MAG: HAD family phosphatase [Bacteroidia bacterium]|nr:HAD family phosphatase [Bacteroidia bacterium]
MAIKNLLFDLGAVILNLDQEKTLRAFKRLGADLDSLNTESSLFTDFETGKITSDFFIHTLQTNLKGKASAQEILDAWNAMLLDLPTFRIDMLKELKKDYRLFLLSNTNTIHIDAVYKTHGKIIFDELFETCYLSHEIGHRKPHVACYQFVMDDAKIKACETLFVDDNKANIRGANDAGLNTIWAQQPLDNWFLDELKKTNVLKVH